MLSFVYAYLFVSPLNNIHMSRLTSITDSAILCKGTAFESSSESFVFCDTIYYGETESFFSFSAPPCFPFFFSYRYPLMFYYLTILTLETLTIISTVLIIFLQPWCRGFGGDFGGMRVYSFPSSVCSISGEYHKINPVGFKIYMEKWGRKQRRLPPTLNLHNWSLLCKCWILHNPHADVKYF